MRYRRIASVASALALLAVWSIGCAPISPKSDWTAERLYEFGQGSMEKKDWLRALEAFRMLTLNYSGSDLIDESLFYLGQAHEKINEYPVAVVTYKRLLRDFPQSPYADNAQYQLAWSLFEQSSAVQLTQDKTFEAIRELQIFLDEYADSELAPQANQLRQRCYDKIAEKDYKTGHLYLRLRDWEAARLYFGEMIEEFPTSNWAPIAQFEIAESYAREKKFEDAIQRFTLFIQSYPGHKLWPDAKLQLEKAKLLAAKPSSAMKTKQVKGSSSDSTSLTKTPTVDNQTKSP